MSFKRISIGIISLALTCFSSCTPSSLFSLASNEALLAGGALAAGGGAIGYFVGDEIDYAEDGLVIGAAAGSALGLLAGANAYENRVEEARETLPVKRVPLGRSDAQWEIDAEARATHDATKLGKGEVKSWEDRYIDYEDNLPYQGGVGY